MTTKTKTKEYLEQAEAAVAMTDKHGDNVADAFDTVPPTPVPKEKKLGGNYEIPQAESDAAAASIIAAAKNGPPRQSPLSMLEAECRVMRRINRAVEELTSPASRRRVLEHMISLQAELNAAPVPACNVRAREVGQQP